MADRPRCSGTVLAATCGGLYATGAAPRTIAPAMAAAAKPSAAHLAAGKKAFLSVGCSGCHMLTAAGSTANAGPSLNHIGKFHDAKWILVQIADPCARGHEHAAGANYTCLAMPAGLAKGKTAEAIAAFLAAQK